MTLSYRIPGMRVVDHVFAVPVDHDAPDGETIEVFARELVDPARADEHLPWLLYLQGGPGGKSPRPTRPGTWIRRALRTHRVLLLDQRGTGRSSPVTARTVAGLGGPQRVAGYLRHFRADAIVRDAELVRARLCPDEPWETLGQSYGGFVTMNYLSLAPQALRACYVTGGLPGLGATARDVYARTYPRVRDKNHAYYRRFPHDVARVTELLDHLSTQDVRLPDGDRLTPHRLRCLGLSFGMCDGFERVHWLLDEAWVGSGAGRQISDTFRAEVMTLTGFVDRPLFVLMQEACYGQGAATGWAAAELLDRFPEFRIDAVPPLFTGEMFYPWMFEEIAALRPFAPAASALAELADWPPLYDRARLAGNQVPVAAVVYFDDMYVDAVLSLATAREVPGVQVWVTNEWEHDGVSASEDAVLDRLMEMAWGRC